VSGHHEPSTRLAPKLAHGIFNGRGITNCCRDRLRCRGFASGLEERQKFTPRAGNLLGSTPPVAWVKTPVLLGQTSQVENDPRQRVREGARSAGIANRRQATLCAREKFPLPGVELSPSAVPR
jgi:hypothetical protein